MKWDDYFYPGTEVLRNKADLTDPDALNHFERKATGIRDAELRGKPILGDFDLKHMQAMHKHLFQDVYEWAGDLREVELKKGRSLFTFKAFMQRDGAALGKFVRDQHYLRGLDKATFANRLAEVYARINILHPFREGNGRAARAYLAQMAHEAGYYFACDKIDRNEWNLAAAASGSGNFGGLWVNPALRDMSPISHIILQNTWSERALAFEHWPRERALAAFPDLDGALAARDEARRTGQPEVVEEIARKLHEGQWIEGTKDQSHEAVQLAVNAHGLSIHNIDELPGIMEGRVIGVSSHHVVVQVSDTVAHCIERARLDRAVYAHDRISFLQGEGKTHVFEKGKEFLGVLFSGREVETIDYAKGRAGEGGRYDLRITFPDESVEMRSNVGHHELKTVFGEKHANFLAAKAEEGRGVLSCRETLPVFGGEQVTVGRTYTGPILSDSRERIIQLTNEHQIVVHERTHLSGANTQFQVGDKVSISYPFQNVGLVRKEPALKSPELAKEVRQAERQTPCLG